MNMEIRIQETGAVVSEHEFRAMHPNTSFPAVLTLDIVNEFGGDPVMEGARPTPGEFQDVTLGEVVQVNGNWMRTYVTRDWTAEEIDADKERRRTAIQQQIDDLERSAMLNRGSRELELRLMEKEADEKAAALGVTREQVLALVPYYAKVKTLDDQVTALRIQKGAVT
jgi:hypothetical protein